MHDTKYDALKLENQLCFPFYACSREIIKQYKPFLDEIDLTYTQYITMMVLWERKSLTVKELGESLFLDSGTLTPLLKKLEAKRLITRKRSDIDERNLIVTITPEGEQLKEQAIAVPLQMAHYTILNRMKLRLSTGSFIRFSVKILNKKDFRFSLKEIRSPFSHFRKKCIMASYSLE